MIGINIGTAILSTAYALQNRHGNIRNSIKKKFPKFGEFYGKVSSIMEHFVSGYAVTCLGYACQESEPLKEFMLNKFPGSPVEQCGLIAAVGTTSFDLAWETSQAIERKKIKPSQFIGTCAGALTAITINNLEQILSK